MHWWKNYLTYRIKSKQNSVIYNHSNVTVTECKIVLQPIARNKTQPGFSTVHSVNSASAIRRYLAVFTTISPRQLQPSPCSLLSAPPGPSIVSRECSSETALQRSYVSEHISPLRHYASCVSQNASDYFVRLFYCSSAATNSCPHNAGVAYGGSFTMDNRSSTTLEGIHCERRLVNCMLVCSYDSLYLVYVEGIAASDNIVPSLTVCRPHDTHTAFLSAFMMCILYFVHLVYFCVFCVCVCSL